MNNRKTGAEAEERAAEYLSQMGMRIVKRNFRCRQGEIDIIGYHKGYLVFLEVKYRSSDSRGRPEEAVGKSKQRTICRVADFYRCLCSINDSVPIRYDVLAMGGEICWFQNAFPHIYS